MPSQPNKMPAEKEFSVAIAIVTYKRPALLAQMLDSITKMQIQPQNVVVVDNDSQDDTAEVVESFRSALGKNSSGADRLVFEQMPENTGGAGGFSHGTKMAYELGAEWIWLMDDDVAVEPEALNRLIPWTKRFRVIQGRRRNFDGVPFYWQYSFNTRLGIPNPFAKEDFGEKGYLPMNTMCFEGGMFHRSLVEEIGLPDPRFFIYWDDTVYGYLASKVTDCVVVNDFVLHRTRNLNHLDLKVRRLNGTSDMVRYYIMRNRGYMARYFALHGDYNRFCFGAGTALTFAKETIRIAVVDHSWKSGFKSLISGMLDARKIYNDPAWHPMPPIRSKVDNPSAD